MTLPLDDAAAMRVALALARTVQGFSSPNPPVGAVIVRDGTIVGQGATQPRGAPHAEVVALLQAGERARGATLYVTLEPHNFQGRTPPCTDAIIAAGIASVQVAVLDPNPRVAGGGVAQLRAAGIAVEVGLGAAEAARLVAPFAHWLAFHRPLGIAKFASSLDGKIATRTGDARWITGPAARAEGHRLRQASDAIIVGSRTAIIDDPLLTTRLPDLPPDQIRHPLRVVVDAHGSLPATARMLAPDVPGHTLVATTDLAPIAWREQMATCGAEVVVFPTDAAGRVDLAALWDALGARGCLVALIEGGGTLLGAALAAGLVQRVVAFVAPLLIGGSTASGAVGDPGAARLNDAIRLRWTAIQPIGDDIMLHGDVITNG
jgi:diaminohydroxyphosphoribosylaminopyrimidine deaminase/5-amino-6-(5-phosphoribosylamino)uracil reductase